MTEESSLRVSSDESMITTTTDASTSRKRKIRKWDQPADLLVSAGVAVPGIHTLGNVGSLVGVNTLPGVAPVSSAFLQNSHQVLQVPSIQQHAAAAIQKLNLPKIQDELIAREIVINDAESSIRYKLTRRQTQEEIQKCTGAVVITRGKYRPPNALPDGEKPLYLHISSGAYLKEMAERIIAVDRAAAMIEEMMKQGHNSQPVSSTFPSIVNNVVKALSTCVYLGFDADPSVNIAARIRGPNDQYINHIMNETGAAVLLRGRGAGNVEDPHDEEGQQPLHLYLSSNSPKNLEDAKRLAENLLDTISVEFGASRVSSLKVYNAVPPPQQLLAGVPSSGNELKVDITSDACLTSPIVASSPASSLLTSHGVATVLSHGTVSLPGGSLITGQSLSNMVHFPQTSLSGGTSYNGYGGIYPQATPLQQVALALRQSPSGVASNVIPGTSLVSTVPKSNDTSASEKEKGLPRRRKFQELPASAKEPPKQHQDSFQVLFRKPSEPTIDLVVRSVSTMPAAKKLVQSSSSGMPPPPPRKMPPPPPKFTPSTPSPKVQEKSDIKNLSKYDTVPDTLIKLMEYGEDDDDAEETSEEPLRSNLNPVAAPKPFWAL